LPIHFNLSRTTVKLSALYAFLIGSNISENRNEGMHIETVSFETTQAAQKKAEFDIARLVVYHGTLLPFADITLTATPRYFYIIVALGTHLSPNETKGLYMVALFSLMTMTYAATDCEILNSGISSISATACCIIKGNGISCSPNGRVIQMYA
jgi:ABC-type amino acid transport system permease subunit